METDLTKIEKFAKEKEDENWSFRAFLKNYDEKNLDSTVYRMFKKVDESIDCTTCGNCCKKIKPLFTKKDIRRLAASLNITFDQFIGKFVEEDEDGDQVLNQTPCPFLSNNKCTQYDSRPEDCASYPHLHKKGFVSRLIGVVYNYSVCPIVFNVYEALKKELKVEFKDFQNEMDRLDYY